ncbi:hypothetical protein GCM10022226_14960 [Sphaerisporangium flaviroseum]|uniref:Uncharacterized protein n=1 Tax=Sphaerisporangium flaviroseum TaxID=509199 RepID=A0ABP7HM68_9ACTN
MDADLRHPGQRAGAFEGDFGVGTQVDHVAQFDLADEPFHVGVRQALEVVGPQHAPESGRLAVDRGKTAKISHVHGTVKSYPPR